MGPPIKVFDLDNPDPNPDPNWTIYTSADSNGITYIKCIQGVDTELQGSWRKVWYRTTAWTSLDVTRGQLPGRSPASNAVWVILPPPNGPDVIFTSQSPGTNPEDVIIEWNSDAPTKDTNMTTYFVYMVHNKRRYKQ